MLAITVASYIRLDKTEFVVSSDNFIFSKIQQNATQNGCNLASGRWIYDNISYPLYKEKDCTFIGNDLTCERYGREDLKYQNWRWQPHHCDLPRFNGTALLEILRNKRLIFVGDSLNQNQWTSLMCMIEPDLPPTTNKTIVLDGNLLKLHVEDYNATIGFYWSPYLVESDGDDVYRHNQNQHTVRIKSIEKHGINWNDADILIFDTFAWWLPKMTILWGSFEDPNAVYQKVKSSGRPYEIAIDTWANWLEYHINRNKTRIFFTSASPQSIGLTPWGNTVGCNNKTEPTFDDIYWQSHPKLMMNAVESTIEKLKERGVNVQYLNITQLSSYRQDAYQSVYTRDWKDVHLKDRDPNRSDCCHWCLPGVPDVWNEILYAYIIKS
ncbi:protein trichome birefringence-like 34 [Salvia hispanica]|uniref:protein trichome birefringence-like 34 n=1 Tax=Salvia hispanica TaxID=49212 RepID=UPI00200950D8|nr:protein trichome birefringence-like 34 [Salvia hispanica]